MRTWATRVLAACVMAAVVPGGLMSGAVAQDDVATTAVKRYFLTHVNARCGLLDEATARALSAGYVQARNAVLRNGHAMARLSPWLARARTAAAQADCASAEVAAEVELARGGYQRFMAQSGLDLPTGRTTWQATRAHQDAVRWRLVQYQNTANIDAALGLYGTLDSYGFAVMVRFPDGAKPYSARLLVRDPARARTGLIDDSAYDLSRSMPMGMSETGQVSFMARAVSQATVRLAPYVTANAAGFSLTGQHVGRQDPVAALRFDFPSQAFPAIARLDPREDMIVVFECDDGPRYLRFEVGDFITGLTYVGLPSPYGQA